MLLFTTPPLHIVDRPADSAHKGGKRLGYRFFVIHSTATPLTAKPTPLENALAYLTTTSPPSRPVSTHRVIAKSGQIYKLVPDNEVAWHAGFAQVGPLPHANSAGVVVESLNQWSLGIELDNDNSGRDPYTDAQMESCAAQLAEWIGAYGFLAPVGHGWIDRNKTDPKGFDWEDLYRRIWARLKVL